MLASIPLISGTLPTSRKGFRKPMNKNRKSNAVSEEEMRMVETSLTPSAWLELEG